MLKWAPGPQQVANVMTKVGLTGCLESLLREDTGVFARTRGS